MSNVTKIPCRLESVSVDRQLGGANQIYDDDLQSFQNTLNASYNNHIGNTSIHITQQERNTWNNAVESIPTKINELDDKISDVKSDVSTGFARVDASIKELGFYEQNPEFINATLDSSNKIMYGVQSDGNFYFGGGVPSQIKNYVIEKDNDILNKVTQLVNDSGFVTSEDLAQKEDKMPLINVTGTTLDASSSNYYRINNVGTLTITLPTITGSTRLQAITFLLICGASARIKFLPQGSETIMYQEGFVIDINSTYEVTALWNGSEWTLSRSEYTL